ncbi:MAG: transporter, partial [Candidatus Zixiibacteriota bacterium]
MNKWGARDIAFAGIIAALYAVLTISLAPISYGVYQIRVAEALTILP